MKRPLRSGRGRVLQKQAPKGMPSWIPTRTFRTYPRGGGSRLVDFPLVNLAGGGALDGADELHRHERVVLARRQAGPPGLRALRPRPARRGFALAIRVAHLIREELERLELDSYVKTSGADGIHVLVPIARRATYEQTYTFAERRGARARGTAPRARHHRVAEAQARGVLVDHRQNARQDDRVGLLRTAEAGSAGLDAAPLGRAHGGRGRRGASGCGRRSIGSSGTATCSSPCSQAGRRSVVR